MMEEDPVDCILLDHNLPDGYGADVVAEFRRRQGAVAVAAVYLTNAALQAGAQDFVSKDGLTPETVWRAVDSAIERVGMTRALAESEGRFRAPMRAIVSSCRILIEDYADRLSPDAQAEFDRQAAAWQKLGRLVDDLLVYARLGGDRIRRLPVDLSALATGVAAPLLEEADFRIAPGLHAVADPTMIEIVLTIRFDNAVKHRRPGTRPRIEFDRDGEAFRVLDDGIGFDMRFVGKLFQPFERLHRDQDYAGTGIGLANACRIVERHGGRIWAESEPERGARFRFTLGVRH